VFGDALRGRLLQRVAGEQPVRRVIEFRRRPAAQQHRLHEGGRVVAEPPSYRCDVGHPARIGQPVAIDIVQRLRTHPAAQISDKLEVEIYDGLTPVIMTL
jgi:hypothetical protein